MKTQVNIWDKYKKIYENDPFVKYVDVARMAGVSKQRIDQVAKKDGWKKIVTKKEAIEKKIIDYVNEINAKGIFETMEDIVKNVGLHYKDVRLTFKKI
jgi:predicted DNA-binding protein